MPRMFDTVVTQTVRAPHRGCRGEDPAFARKLTAYVTLQSGRLEECVNEWRDRRTLCQHQQHAKQNERDNYWREPILFILFHELPEFADYLCFRHLTLLNTTLDNGCGILISTQESLVLRLKK